MTLKGTVGARIDGSRIWEAIRRVQAHTGWAALRRKCCRHKRVDLDIHKRIQAGEVIAEIPPADAAIGGNGQSGRRNEVGNLRGVRRGWVQPLKPTTALLVPEEQIRER